MSMIYDIQYIVNNYMNGTNMWNEIQAELEATDHEMEEAFEDEISDNMASKVCSVFSVWFHVIYCCVIHKHT